MSRGGRRAPRRIAGGSRIALGVGSIGYLVAHTDFACKVQSTFSHACNFEHDAGMLTLVARPGANGPTTLVLDCDLPDDLRALFEPGEVVNWHNGTARACRVEIRFGEAAIWRPAARRDPLPPSRFAANFRLAEGQLAHWRCDRSSVIDREGAVVVESFRTE